MYYLHVIYSSTGSIPTECKTVHRNLDFAAQNKEVILHPNESLMPFPSHTELIDDSLECQSENSVLDVLHMVPNVIFTYIFGCVKLKYPGRNIIIQYTYGNT